MIRMKDNPLGERSTTEPTTTPAIGTATTAAAPTHAVVNGKTDSNVRRPGVPPDSVTAREPESSETQDIHSP